MLYLTVMVLLSFFFLIVTLMKTCKQCLPVISLGYLNPHLPQFLFLLANVTEKKGEVKVRNNKELMYVN